MKSLITINEKDFLRLADCPLAVCVLLHFLKEHGSTDSDFRAPLYEGRYYKWRSYEWYFAIHELIRRGFIIQTHVGGHGPNDYNLYAWVKTESSHAE